MTAPKKPCVECGEEKPLKSFGMVYKGRYKRVADPTRYKNTCKECSRALNGAKVDPNFHPDHKPKKVKQTDEEKKAYAAAYKRRKRRETRIKALQYVADKGCCECGERDPRVLEFDHIDPTQKHDHICRLLGNGFGWGSEKLRAEIRKCRIICANCHRKHTVEQQGYYGQDDVAAALRAILDKYGISDPD